MAPGVDPMAILLDDTSATCLEPVAAMTVAISAFYKFVRIDDPSALRARLHSALAAHDMKGTLLIATEGINGTVSGTPSAMTTLLAALRSDARFADLSTKDTTADAHPFQRLKVKVKPEIITFRQPGADPLVTVGTYVAPQNWNALITDPDVFLLDTRNAYEVAAGTFAGAIDPQTRHFSDWPNYARAQLDPKKHRKIAMFCTGGIRCEKASAYLKSQGFADVYHLQGGILNYLAKVPVAESLWHGECFVFDEREAIDGDD
jgi:UPF0176 protein